MSPLKKIYLIASDVPLLQQEARDALREKAKSAQFLQRETYYLEAGFSATQLFTSLQNFNLFSEKTFIEVYNPSAKFDEATVKQLIDYTQNPASDKILLFLTEKLTAAQQKTRWYKAIESAGACLNLRAITKADLPAWIQQRAKQQSVHLEPPSVMLLAELTEGNLLATQQALIKLTLLYPNETITTQKLLHAISDSARFNVFDLTETILKGQGAAALRLLQGLKQTGTEPTLILWSLCRELRELGQLLFHKQRGAAWQELLQRQWQQRRTLLKNALMRFSLSGLNKLLLLAESTDHAIKGQSLESAWDKLEQLTARMATTHENKTPHRPDRRHV